MDKGTRILWIAGIFLVDVLIFMLPICAFIAAYVIWFRPPWFRDWVAEVYA